MTIRHMSVPLSLALRILGRDFSLEGGGGTDEGLAIISVSR